MAGNRNWCFTLNNSAATHDAFEGVTEDKAPLSISDPRVKYLHYQLEKAPTTGELHYQGFIHFNKQVRLASAKVVIGYDSVHLEPMRGTVKDNISYCSKSDTKVMGPWIYGEAPNQGSRTDLSEVATAIKAGANKRKIAEDFPEAVIKFSKGLDTLRHALDHSPKWRHLTVTWIWGKTGTGKTRMVMDTVDDPSQMYIVHSHGQWWDGYDGQEAILFDDFYGQIKLDEMLRYLDGHPLQLPIKGGFVWAKFTKVYFTSNVHYLDIYKGENIPAETKLAFERRIHEIIQK